MPNEERPKDAPVSGSAAAWTGWFGRRARISLVVGTALGLMLAISPSTPAAAAVCAPNVSSLVCSERGTGGKPPPKPPAPTWLVKYRVWTNHIKIYKNGHLARDVKVAGNPYLSPQLPKTCHISQKLRVNWDTTLVWKLNYFTRLCAGRGVGTHAIPLNRYSGRMSMNPADLGKTPGAGSPISHGCARMLEKDAKWIYTKVPLGTTVKISYAR
jgi:hypothetical protein